MDIVLANILKILEKKGKTQTELCVHLNISKQAITNWKNGNNKSYMKRTKEISEFLGCSLADIYGLSPVVPVQVSEDLVLSPDETELIKSYRMISNENKKKLRSAILSMILED